MQVVGWAVQVNEGGRLRPMTDSERDEYAPVGEPLDTLGKVFMAKEGLRKLFFRGDMIYIEDGELRTACYRQSDIASSLNEVLDQTGLQPGMVCYGRKAEGPAIFGRHSEDCRLLTEEERELFVPTERTKFIMDAARILCEGVDDNSLSEVYDRLVKK